MFPNKPLTPDTVDAAIVKCFRQSSRIKNLSRHYRKRLAKHGKDTLFFRFKEFIFIIQDKTIVTVEVAVNESRHLNKDFDFLQPTPQNRPKKAAKPPHCPKSLPNFRLFAAANDDYGNLHFVNLGSYDSVAFNGCIEKLCGNKTFQDEMRRRFREKRPLWTMLSVYASLGNRGEQIKVIDELGYGLMK